MTVTVVDPPTGAYMGYGQRILVHTDVPSVTGELFEGQLTFVDAGAATRTIAKASGQISAVSGNASLQWGLTYFDEFYGIPPIDPRGLALGAPIDLVLQHRNLAHTLVDSASFTGYFLHDPVSQLPSLVVEMLRVLHDPMLDEILAAVKKTYT